MNAKPQPPQKQFLFILGIGALTALVTLGLTVGGTLLSFDSLGLDWGYTILLFGVPFFAGVFGMAATWSVIIHAWYLQRRRKSVPTSRYFLTFGIVWLVAALVFGLIFALTVASFDFSLIILVTAVIAILVASVLGARFAGRFTV